MRKVDITNQATTRKPQKKKQLSGKFFILSMESFKDINDENYSYLLIVDSINFMRNLDDKIDITKSCGCMVTFNTHYVVCYGEHENYNSAINDAKCIFDDYDLLKLTPENELYRQCPIINHTKCIDLFKIIEKA